MPLNTKRLLLLPATIDTLAAAIEGDTALAHLLQVNLPDQWTEFGTPVFQYALDKISTEPKSAGWWTYFPILKASNTLIGSCGYKGPPRAGEVEIGYEIAPAYRQQGYATEMVGALIKNAWQHPEVNTICAHTLPEENPSTRILLKYGMKKTAAIDDPEDGTIWRWELKRRFRNSL